METRNTVTHTLYIGHHVDGALAHTQQDIIDIIGPILNCPFTVSPGVGYGPRWGTEQTTIVHIVGDWKDVTDAIVRRLCGALNQEAILWTETAHDYANLVELD